MNRSRKLKDLTLSKRVCLENAEENAAQLLVDSLPDFEVESESSLDVSSRLHKTVEKISTRQRDFTKNNTKKSTDSFHCSPPAESEVSTDNSLLVSNHSSFFLTGALPTLSVRSPIIKVCSSSAIPGVTPVTPSLSTPEKESGESLPVNASSTPLLEFTSFEGKPIESLPFENLNTQGPVPTPQSSLTNQAKSISNLTSMLADPRLKGRGCLSSPTILATSLEESRQRGYSEIHSSQERKDALAFPSLSRSPNLLSTFSSILLGKSLLGNRYLRAEGRAQSELEDYLSNSGAHKVLKVGSQDVSNWNEGSSCNADATCTRNLNTSVEENEEKLVDRNYSDNSYNFKNIEINKSAGLEDSMYIDFNNSDIINNSSYFNGPVNSNVSSNNPNSKIGTNESTSKIISGSPPSQSYTLTPLQINQLFLRQQQQLQKQYQVQHLQCQQQLQQLATNQFRLQQAMQSPRLSSQQLQQLIQQKTLLQQQSQFIIQSFQQFQAQHASQLLQLQQQQQQQQRQLAQEILHVQDYLRKILHSQACPTEMGCSEPCIRMKKVFRHLLVCDGKLCTDHSCLSSRRIISHYQKCEQANCQICLPFRQPTPQLFMQQQQNMANAPFLPATPAFSASAEDWRAKLKSKERFNRIISAVVVALQKTLPGVAPEQLLHAAQKLEQSAFSNATSEVEYIEQIKLRLHQIETTQQQKQFQQHQQQQLFMLQQLQQLQSRQVHMLSPLIKQEVTVTPELNRPTVASSATTPHLNAYTNENVTISSRSSPLPLSGGEDHNATIQQHLHQNQLYQLLQQALFKQRNGDQLTPLELHLLEQMRRNRPKTPQEPIEPLVPIPHDGAAATGSVELPLKKDADKPADKPDENRLKAIKRPRYTPQEVKSDLLALHEAMMREHDALPFNEPVDPELLKIPDYFDIIKSPMDFATIRNKLKNFEYIDHIDYCHDVHLVFMNAWTYNSKNSKVYKMCTNMSKYFTKAIGPVMKELGYCCEGRKLEFKPTPVFCCSIQCQYAPIPRLQPYHVTSEEPAYSVCQKCFAGADVAVAVVHEYDTNFTVDKEKFSRKINDAIEYEPLLECHGCGMRCHHICRLYNKLTDKHIYCKKCVDELNIDVKANRVPSESLTRTKLGDFLEERVSRFLTGSGAPPVIVRVVCQMNKINQVAAGMRKRYPDYPAEFPYRHKALFCFQKIDGVDVCFFGMHVQEYGSDAPLPNRNRVYISYLDSVYYFQPPSYRTAVYHEFLISYLEYCGKLGYLYAHIWACPPAQGDDYIFHCHPEDQKVPKPKRLQEWYRTMLSVAKERKAIVDFRNIIEQKELENISSVKQIPYLAGDYWPDVMEQQIVKIEEEKNAEDTSEGVESSKKSNKKTNKKKNTANHSSLKKRSTKVKKLERQSSELAEVVFEFMNRNKDVFFIIDLNRKGSSAKRTIVDPDPINKCELMEGREGFLNIARENHYQFNTLRNAKYSSMMLLYHLKHSNESMDSEFTCNLCECRLTPIDPRYHCTGGCEDYDMCKKCYDTRGHEHEMNMIGLIMDDDKDDHQGAEPRRSSLPLTPEERKLRMKRALDTVMHACLCSDSACQKDSCLRIKQMVLHSRQCQQSSKCLHCGNLFSLSMFHVQNCPTPSREVCPFPFCNQIKQRILQRKKKLKNKRKMKRRRMKEQQALGFQHVASLGVSAFPHPVLPPVLPNTESADLVVGGAPPESKAGRQPSTVTGATVVAPAGGKDLKAVFSSTKYGVNTCDDGNSQHGTAISYGGVGSNSLKSDGNHDEGDGSNSHIEDKSTIIHNEKNYNESNNNNTVIQTEASSTSLNSNLYDDAANKNLLQSINNTLRSHTTTQRKDGGQPLLLEAPAGDEFSPKPLKEGTIYLCPLSKEVNNNNGSKMQSDMTNKEFNSRPNQNNSILGLGGSKHIFKRSVRTSEGESTCKNVIEETENEEEDNELNNNKKDSNINNNNDDDSNNSNNNSNNSSSNNNSNDSSNSNSSSDNNYSHNNNSSSNANSNNHDKASGGTISSSYGTNRKAFDDRSAQHDAPTNEKLPLLTTGLNGVTSVTLVPELKQDSELFSNHDAKKKISESSGINASNPCSEAVSNTDINSNSGSPDKNFMKLTRLEYRAIERSISNKKLNFSNSQELLKHFELLVSKLYKIKTNMDMEILRDPSSVDKEVYGRVLTYFQTVKRISAAIKQNNDKEISEDLFKVIHNLLAFYDDIQILLVEREETKERGESDLQAQKFSASLEALLPPAYIKSKTAKTNFLSGIQMLAYSKESEGTNKISSEEENNDMFGHNKENVNCNKSLLRTKSRRPPRATQKFISFKESPLRYEISSYTDRLKTNEAFTDKLNIVSEGGCRIGLNTSSGAHELDTTSNISRRRVKKLIRNTKRKCNTPIKKGMGNVKVSGPPRSRLKVSQKNKQSAKGEYSVTSGHFQSTKRISPQRTSSEQPTASVGHVMNNLANTSEVQTAVDFDESRSISELNAGSLNTNTNLGLEWAKEPCLAVYPNSDSKSFFSTTSITIPSVSLMDPNTFSISESSRINQLVEVMPTSLLDNRHLTVISPHLVNNNCLQDDKVQTLQNIQPVLSSKQHALHLYHQGQRVLLTLQEKIQAARLRAQSNAQQIFQQLQISGMDFELYISQLQQHILQIKKSVTALPQPLTPEKMLDAELMVFQYSYVLDYLTNKQLLSRQPQASAFQQNPRTTALDTQSEKLMTSQLQAPAFSKLFLSAAVSGLNNPPAQPDIRSPYIPRQVRSSAGTISQIIHQRLLP